MFKKPLLSRLLAVLCVVVVGLMGCSSTTTSGLTGNYREDTITVVEHLDRLIDFPNDAPNLAAEQALARQEMNDYAALYRRNSKVSGLRSFTTMQTALNSLAGYYSSYGSRPLSEKLKQRLHKEFKDVQFSLKRGF